MQYPFELSDRIDVWSDSICGVVYQEFLNIDPSSCHGGRAAQLQALVSDQAA